MKHSVSTRVGTWRSRCRESDRRRRERGAGRVQYAGRGHAPDVAARSPAPGRGGGGSAGSGGEAVLTNPSTPVYLIRNQARILAARLDLLETEHACVEELPTQVRALIAHVRTLPNWLCELA